MDPPLLDDDYVKSRIDDYEDILLQEALALSMQEQQQPPAAAAAATPATATPFYSNTGDHMSLQEREDAELQAALALSLGIVNNDSNTNTPNTTTTSATAATTATTPMEIDDDDDDRDIVEDRKLPAIPKLPPLPAVPNPLHFSGRVRKWYSQQQQQQQQQQAEDNSSSNTDMMAEIHALLWDSTITTVQDQQRWVSQGIQFKQQQSSSQHSSFLTATSMASSSSSSLPAAVVANPQATWGLTQEHGGPCGVLAAIQAELLRVLLFGERTTHPLSMIPIQVPSSLDDMMAATTTTTTTAMGDDDLSPSSLTPLMLQQTLALSMGIILARASIVPPASSSSSSSDTAAEESASLLINKVQIVLPKPDLWGGAVSNLEWRHFDPWPTTTTTTTTGVSATAGTSDEPQLVTYTISLSNNNVPSSNDKGNPDDSAVPPAAAVDGQDQATAKRQKRTEDSSAAGASADSSMLDDNETDINELANAVAQFLLETSGMAWFQRPGGVLLFLLSLIQTRTISTIQADMDDATSKLTSNFGHCSQELINLLLTGQSVSNVFDNTLSPSGELVCRGIQKRPAIGYLSQLEAMRYLEVGGHYKRPRFPIWIIGSSSHFSVMFGEEPAVQESSSDALLEKVRRTFKGMEGGAEENGFIQTCQLDSFFKKVGLERLAEHEVQMLSATMEAYGAGIVLWEELWKKTSRLLTGASVESVLQSSSESDLPTSSLMDSEGISRRSSFESAAAATSDAPMSDEDLARLLQAELNGGVVDMTGIGFDDATAMTCKATSTSDAASTTAVAAPEGRTEPSGSGEYGLSFQLFHYNGLRGGTFRKLRVTRLNADEAIGASIPLGASQNHTMAGMGADLEDVVRTKWPSCRVDWLGGSIPSID